MPPRHHRSQEHAAEALGRVAPLVSRWVERLLAANEPPLTLAQYLVLQTVADGGLVGAELARRAAVSPSATAQLLAALEEAGLLERTRATDDRRRHDLGLSESGQTALEAAQGLLRERLSVLLSDLPRPEADALVRSLERLEASMTGAPPPPRPKRRPPPPPHAGGRKRRGH